MMMIMIDADYHKYFNHQILIYSNIKIIHDDLKSFEPGLTMNNSND